MLIFIGVAPSDAEKRVAFVVSNCDYEHADILADPVTDARHMREALQRLGFVIVYGEKVGLQEAPARLGRLSQISALRNDALGTSRRDGCLRQSTRTGLKPTSVGIHTCRENFCRSLFATRSGGQQT